MSVCAACEQLRRQPSDVSPHSALLPLVGHSRVPSDDNSGLEGPHARYLCRMCRAIMLRDAVDDNSNPIWDLYAG